MASASPDLESTIDSFMQSRRAMNASPQTLFNYEKTLERFRAWAEGRGVRRARAITPDLLREWLVYLQIEHTDGRAKVNPGRLLTSETVLTYFVRVRTWLRWLRREGTLRKDPTERVTRPKVERREVAALGDAEAAALLDLFTTHRAPYEETKFLGDDRRRFLLTRNRAIVGLLLDTGARRLEAVMLDLADVDFGERLVKVMGKGRKERRQPFSAAALRLLQAWLRERDRAFPEMRGRGPLFLNVTGSPLTTGAIRNLFRRAKAALGIKGRVSAHTLRHTAALLAHRGGASTFELQRFLGHASPVATARYAALFPEDLVRGHRVWSPVERLLRGR